MKAAKYLSIIGGAAVIAFGMYNIHARAGISEGGALGLILLLQHWLHLSPAIGSFLIDGTALIAGTILLKSSFLADSLTASLSFSLCYRILEQFEPLLPDLSAWPWLAAILGGLFVGIGTTLIVRHGCAAGADDSFALIANAKLHIRLSTYYFFSDFAVLLLSLSYIPVARIAWSFLTVFVSSGLIGLLCPDPAGSSPKSPKKA